MNEMNYGSRIMEIINYLINPENIIYILIIIIGAIIVYKLGNKFLRKMEEQFDLNLTAHYLFKDLLKYTIILVAFALILHVLGINLESIIISLGIVGIAIGFASQDIVSNFLSVEVNDFKGTIRKVGFRNTTMINQDNHEITIPNSLLSKNIYKLYPPTEDHRLRITAVLPHGINLDQFKEELDKVMFSYDWVVKDKTTFFSRDYSEFGPKVEVSYWIKEYKYIDCGKIRILESINRISDEYRKNN